MQEIGEMLKENKWEIETWFSNNTMFVAHRGYSTIIGYPNSDKFRENGLVDIGLRRRLATPKRSKPWFTEQIDAKDAYINELLNKIDKP